VEPKEVGACKAIHKIGVTMNEGNLKMVLGGLQREVYLGKQCTLVFESTGTSASL